MTVEGNEATAPEPQAVVQAFQQFAQGQQDAAVATLKPSADNGSALGGLLIAWFLHQMGDPKWREAIPYASAAVEAGYPQAASYVVGNMMNDPGLRTQALDLARKAAAMGVPVLDPIGQLQSLAQNGDVNTITEILLNQPWPYRWGPERWPEMIREAEEATRRIGGIVEEAADKREATLASIQEASDDVTEMHARLRQQSKDLTQLISQTTNAQATTFFEGEASSSEGQANTTWRIGVTIISVAAFFGILPLLIHYTGQAFQIGDYLSDSQLTTAHVTATLAMATVAGVVLTRSRVRDRNRQRNQDLAVALKTMFAQGGQIENLEERQAFIRDMGRTIIEAHLRHDPVSEDDVRGILGLLTSRS